MKSKFIINANGSITTKGTVTFNKNGKLIIPVSFLENMGINQDSNRKVKITFQDGKIIIEKEGV